MSTDFFNEEFDGIQRSLNHYAESYQKKLVSISNKSPLPAKSKVLERAVKRECLKMRVGI